MSARTRHAPVWLAPRRLRALLRGDGGMSTAEYAMGTVAAVAFASILYKVVTGDSVAEALASLIQRGLEGGGI
ncbi:DUF4244 domain-containing protein [Saccharopolyspora thermophila]|nr:DUF4244 domain-containing protein [Saccharopolyspora subtropica]